MNLKGFTCPECHGVRLQVMTTYKPSSGLIVRYRQCTACGHRTVTEERVSKTRRSKRSAKGSNQVRK